MANGDIAITTPPTIASLPLAELNITVLPSVSMTITFFETDATGKSHTVRMVNASNGGVTGFDLTGGVFTDNVSRTGATFNNYLTAILGVLFIGNATTLNQRKTALVQRLVTDGAITVTGTVA